MRQLLEGGLAVRAVIDAIEKSSDEYALFHLKQNPALLKNTDILEKAVRCRQFNIVQWILSEGVSHAGMKKPQGNWGLMLYYACFENVAMLQLLLHSPAANINARIGQNSINLFPEDTALHAFLRNNSHYPNDTYLDSKKYTVNLFLEHDADLSIRDRLGDTPLHILAGDVTALPLLEILLQHRSSTNSINQRNGSSENEYGVVIKYGNTPLLVATLYTNTRAVELLLTFGAIPDIQGEFKATALHFAASKGSIEIVNILLKAGADINAQEQYGQTPLMVALSCGQTQIVQLLMAKGADLTLATYEDKMTAMHYLLDTEDYYSLFEEIAEKNVITIAKTDHPNAWGDTLLVHAMKRFNQTAIKWLIQHGANLNTLGFAGETPLHAAVILFSRSEIPHLLLAAGANINAQDQYGYTPLMTALLSQKSVLGEWFIQQGADLMLTTQDDQMSALHYMAEKEQYLNLLELSLDTAVANNLNIDDQNRWGETPLMRATMFANVEAVTMLLKYGADPSIAKYSLETPLHMATTLYQETLNTDLSACLKNIIDQLVAEPYTAIEPSENDLIASYSRSI